MKSLTQKDIELIGRAFSVYRKSLGDLKAEMQDVQEFVGAEIERMGVLAEELGVPPSVYYTPFASPATRDVPAEVHSDDHAVEVDFFADEWLRQATDDQILRLAKCGWGGDYPADAVAEFMAEHDSGVARLFTYLTTGPKMSFTGDTVGYECQVDEGSAMTWLEWNRPDVYSQVRSDEDVPLSGPGR